jgi:hypothetical protein
MRTAGAAVGGTAGATDQRRDRSPRLEWKLLRLVLRNPYELNECLGL